MRKVSQNYPEALNLFPALPLRDNEYLRLNRLIFLYSLKIEIPEPCHMAISRIFEFLDFSEEKIVSNYFVNYCYLNKHGKIIFSIKKDTFRNDELTMCSGYEDFCRSLSMETELHIEYSEMLVLGMIVLFSKGIYFDYFIMDVFILEFLEAEL